MIGQRFAGGVGRFCRRAGGCLINQHPALYAVWYLISILVFALVYCLLPAEAFHAPYVAREPQTSENGYSFEPFMIERMRQSAESWSDANYVDYDMRNIAILRTGADPSRNTVRVVIGYKLAGKPQQTAAIDIDVFSLPAGGDRCHDVRIAQDESSADAESNAIIADILFHDNPGCASAHYLRLTPDDETAFRAYALALSGRAKYVRHFGLRMIAYSAMTITTTSDNSLVPTMRSARLAVALEPLWGLLLIGLTFRAVVRREFAMTRQRS
jgi:hypothetical protein